MDIARGTAPGAIGHQSAKGTRSRAAQEKAAPEVPRSQHATPNRDQAQPTGMGANEGWRVSSGPEPDEGKGAGPHIWAKNRDAKLDQSRYTNLDPNRYTNLAEKRVLGLAQTGVLHLAKHGSRI